MRKAVFLLLLLLPFIGFAATFVVTDNSASGPGSLWQALQSAALNGDASADVITFNLPTDQTTITIGFPYLLSSNLIIDGTTQPTKPFGLTGARVRLQAVACTVGFVIDGQHAVEIYGLWFTGFNKQNASCQSAALSIYNTQFFTLGKPGKGNCFTDNAYCIIAPWQPGDMAENINITVQSNRFAIDTLTAPDYKPGIISFGACRKFLFGGNNVSEGNKTGNAFVNVGNIYVPLKAVGDTIAFKNNTFGFDAFNGPLLSAVGLSIAGYKAAGSALNVIIANNKIGKDDENNKISLTDIMGNIEVQDNYIGSLNTAVTPGDVVAAIYIEHCAGKDSISVRNNIVNGYKHGIRIVSTTDVTILNNAFYCNQKGISYANLANTPIVSLQELTPTFIKGFTTPLSTVQIFTSQQCAAYCENGKTLVTTLTADNSGAFAYSGTLNDLISVTATTPSGTTGEFYGAKFSVADVVVKNATCNLKNGFIKSLVVLKATSFHWEDDGGKVVSTDTALVNVGPGIYRFMAQDKFSKCAAYSPFFTLKNIPKPAVESTFTVTNTSCNKSQGKIVFTGTRLPESVHLWQDSLYKTIQTGGDSILRLAPGQYNYKLALAEDSACYTSYGPFKIIDIAGPVLLTAQVQVTPSDCKATTGSVKNISVLNPIGKQYFGWEDSTGKIVANTINLANQPGGRYRLAYKDDSFCDTLFTNYFTIGVKGGIGMDSSRRVIKPSGCVQPTGAITNLVITGADYMEWLNGANQKVGSMADLTKMAEGYYKLVAGNSAGCKDTSTIMHVPQAVFMPVSIVAADVQPPHCDLINGAVLPAKFSADTSLYNFTWTDSLTQNTVSSNTQLQGMNSGDYYLTATDTNGCAAKIYSVHFLQTGRPVFDYSIMTLVHDTCNQARGSIKNVVVTGGQSPYAWTWIKNENTVAYATTQQQVNQLGKGSYRVIVKDVYGCTSNGNTMLIGDFDKQLTKPQADDVLVARNTAATINIKNFQGGSYLLFDTLTATLPWQISNGAQLVTPKVLYDKTFYVRYSLGNCISALAAVLIKVFDKSMVTVPNAFSPNGDGINDVWKLQVQGIVNLKEWKVFNRYGQAVFNAANVNASWNGTYNNAPVAIGTYYWILNASDNEGRPIKLNGSVLVLR